MIDQQGLRACKVTFGAEPTEKEVIEFVDKNWHRLQFCQAIEVPVESARAKVNPKRQLREAKKQMQSQGIGTKSQQALKQQQEQNKIERKQRSKAEREAAKQRQFDLRQAKKKEKHKGH
jgi:Mg-chelatase subunit ChlI